MTLVEEIIEEFDKEFGWFDEWSETPSQESWKEIKSFITSSLKRVAEEMTKQVNDITPDARKTFIEDEGMMTERVDYKREEDWNMGYQQAISDSKLRSQEWMKENL